jgi:hypothetical protein
LKKLKGLIYISLGSGIVAALLGVLSAVFAFDATVEYFDKGSPLYIVSVVMIAVSAVASVVTGILYRSKITLEADFAKKSEKVSFGVGAALIAYTVFTLYEFRLNKDTFALIGIALGAISAIYFLGSFIGSKKRSGYSMLGGFVTVFWCTYVIAINYFDVYTTLNNPLKVAIQIALLAVMLCLLCEFRARLGDARGALHMTLTLITGSLCLYAALPALTCTVNGKTANLRYAFASIVLLAFAAYAIRTSMLFVQASDKDFCSYPKITDIADETESDNDGEEIKADETSTEEETNG